MEKVRKPFQGVLNIIRFNWHFYIISIGLLILLLLIAQTRNGFFQLCVNIISSITIITMLVSLLVSFYVYDLSGLYDFKWMDTLGINEKYTIVNINAGFDETSELLMEGYESG